MLSQSSLNHVRPFALMALLAGLVVALLAVSTAIALRPAAGSSEEPFTIGTDRGWNAVAERYSGLAGDFTQLRAHQAEAARWSGLAHAYGYDAHRAWNAMAERYSGAARLLGGNPATVARSRAAQAARWTGLAQAYMQPGN